MTLNIGKPAEIRLEAISKIKKGVPISTVANDVGVSIQTIYTWLRWYREGGVDNLSRVHSVHNRLPHRIEKKIFLLKEKEPNLSLTRAKAILKKQGIKISRGGIRNIWRRYGLTGFKKENLTAMFVRGIPVTKEMETAVKEAERILEKAKDVKKAAQIINQLPACAILSILEKAPYHYLSLRHKVEKLYTLFGEEPMSAFYHRARNLRKKLEENYLFYSALRAGLKEADALFWLGRPKEVIALIEHLKPKIPEYGDPALRFSFINLEGSSYARMLMRNEGLRCARLCKQLIKTIPLPPFMIGLGTLYMALGEYSKAKLWIEKALSKANDGPSAIQTNILINLGICLSLNGEYNSALRAIKKAGLKDSPAHSVIPIIQAQCALARGGVEGALQYIREGLKTTKKEGIIQYLYGSISVLASLYCGIMQNERAISLIQSYVPLFKRHKMVRDYTTLLAILGRYTTPSKDPFIKTVLLLRKAQNSHHPIDYIRAYRFARAKGLKGFFHRMALFFPRAVRNQLANGAPSYLPRSILRLPVFNEEPPGYYIKFLGKVIVYKNQQYLKVKLRPKDTAFFFHLCQKAMEPKKSVNLDEVYANFWSRNEKAPRNFSHLLVRLKKALKIPAHLLEISRAMGNPILINHGVYFTTDYQEFEQTLARAKALQRAGEWSFARKEYLRAFKLFRGEPFKKNFDNWSVDMRFRILSQLETEAIAFAKSCIERGNKNDAKKICEKILKIIPDSQETIELVKRLNG